MKQSGYDISGEHKLLNWKCIRHIADGDNVLVGKYGQISYYSVEGQTNRHYLVTFWSPQVARRWGVDMVQGEEESIIVDEKTARDIRKQLKTFRSMEQQLTVLLTFGG